MSKGGHTLISKFTTVKDRRKESCVDALEKKRIKEYVKERDNCLNQYSVEALKEFHAKYKDEWDLPPIPEDNEMLEIALNKMCVASTGVYPKIRVKAKKWLLEKGYF